MPVSSHFDDFLTKDLFDWSGWTNYQTNLPKVNIVESNDDFRVEVAAPGLHKDDFQVELDNDTLVIQSMNNTESGDNELNYRRKEFDYGVFKRSFHLPNTVEVENIQANYENGILRLVIPKKEEARKKPVKTIAIA